MRLIEVSSSKQLKKFIRFPIDLYANDPKYVPDLQVNQKNHLSKKNPFFEHSSAKLFLLVKGRNEVIGRIAFIENSVHNKTYNENSAFFGFFDVIKDWDAAKMLFDKVCNLARTKTYNQIIGPTNFTTNDPCGILIDGFDKDPVVLMPYNFEYYTELYSKYGFEKAMDMNSYLMSNVIVLDFFAKPVFNKIFNKLTLHNVQIRPINYSDYSNEIKKLRFIYNESNSDNWGFVPLAKNEFEKMANELRLLIPAELILLAEINQHPVGFIVAVPDYNYVLKKIRSGKLFPFGIFKFLFYKRQIDFARVLILGVLKEHRNIGIDLLLYKTITEQLKLIGINKAEACYVMQNNEKMNSVLKKMGGKILKSFRIYKYDLSL